MQLTELQVRAMEIEQLPDVFYKSFVYADKNMITSSASRSDAELFSWRVWLFIAFLLAIFAMGGGSRADIQSLIILRPMAVVIGFFAMFTLGTARLRRYKWLIILSATPILISAIQLIPLPPELWKSLPGRAIIIEIDTVSGIGDSWRPISMSPVATWNALFAFLVPFATVIFFIHLDKSEKRFVLPVLIGIGLLSGVVGILQLTGSSGGPLYLYRITNEGAAVGLFSNRNHQAIFLSALFSMIAVQLRIAWINGKARDIVYTNIALLLSIILLPLILVTGSRAGVAIALLSGLSAMFLLQIFSRRRVQWIKDMPGRKKTVFGVIVVGAFSLMAFIIFRVVFARSTAIDRMLDVNWEGEARAEHWPVVLEAAKTYFPAGSGIGTFDTVYKITEPDSQLGPNYLNHAHNDWLEIIMTWGVSGILFFGALGFWFVVLSTKLWRSHITTRGILLGRLGSVLILLLAAASMVDYPLRVPSIACLMMIAAVWLKDGSDSIAEMKEN